MRRTRIWQSITCGLIIFMGQALAATSDKENPFRLVPEEMRRQVLAQVNFFALTAFAMTQQLSFNPFPNRTPEEGEDLLNQTKEKYGSCGAFFGPELTWVFTSLSRGSIAAAFMPQANVNARTAIAPAFGYAKDRLDPNDPFTIAGKKYIAENPYLHEASQQFYFLPNDGANDRPRRNIKDEDIRILGLTIAQVQAAQSDFIKFEIEMNEFTKTSSKGREEITIRKKQQIARKYHNSLWVEAMEDGLAEGDIRSVLKEPNMKRVDFSNLINYAATIPTLEGFSTLYPEVKFQILLTLASWINRLSGECMLVQEINDVLTTLPEPTLNRLFAKWQIADARELLEKTAASYDIAMNRTIDLADALLNDQPVDP